MSGPSRPIPISHGHRSQRGSPVPSADANDMISQSAPVNGHGAPFFGPSAHRHERPPRAPVIGSLPEPSFMMAEGGDAMPELALPPPAHVDHETGSLSSTPGRAAVIHVASSCPSDLGFFRQAHQRSWTPSPRASDEFDLSKSPALAVMSAMRQGRRRPSFDLRRCDEEPSEEEGEEAQQQHNPQYPPHQTPSQPYGIVGRSISDPPFRAAPSNSFVSSSQFYFQDDRMNAELHSQQLAMESLSLGGSSASSELGTSSEGVSMGLPPRRPERRGSYDGGIFHFEDQ